MPTIDIRPAIAADAARLAAIYNGYILDTTISFEEQPVTESEMAARIADVGAAGLPWLVALHDGVLVGYA